MNLLAQKIYESVPDTRVLICSGEMGCPRNDRLVFYRTFVGLGLNPNAATSPIQDVIQYAERMPHAGLYFQRN